MPWFTQNKVVGRKHLTLNMVVHAHQIQNLHLENQCCVRVWKGDLGLAKQYYYIRLMLSLSPPGIVVVFLFKL